MHKPALLLGTVVRDTLEEALSLETRVWDTLNEALLPRTSLRDKLRPALLTKMPARDSKHCFWDVPGAPSAVPGVVASVIGYL
jgi:bacterioferritin (cytochrome b1)